MKFQCCFNDGTDPIDTDLPSLYAIAQEYGLATLHGDEAGFVVATTREPTSDGHHATLAAKGLSAGSAARIYRLFANM